MSYGNILSVYESDDQTIANVISILDKSPYTTYIRIESTFFIETKKKEHTTDFMEIFDALDLKYSLIHITIKAGIAVRSNNIGIPTHERIYNYIIA
jgi:hypothetical protein